MIQNFCRWERERELAIARKREDFDDDDEARMKGRMIPNVYSILEVFHEELRVFPCEKFNQNIHCAHLMF